MKPTLEDEGFGARSAGNSDDATAAITARRPSLLFLDIWVQGSKLDGLQLLLPHRFSESDWKGSDQPKIRNVPGDPELGRNIE